MHWGPSVLTSSLFTGQISPFLSPVKRERGFCEERTGWIYSASRSTKEPCCHNTDRCAAWCGLNSTFYAGTHAKHEGFRAVDFLLTGIIGLQLRTAADMATINRQDRSSEFFACLRGHPFWFQAWPLHRGHKNTSWLLCHCTVDG